MKSRKKTSPNNNVVAKLPWLLIILLGSALFTINVQNRQELRSRGGVDNIIVQCSQYPTVDIAFAFTNTESYPINLVAKLSNDPGGNTTEITNIPPGETRNGILDSQKPSLSSGTLIFTWSPSEANNSAPAKSTTKTFKGMICDYASLTATLPANPGLSDQDGSSNIPTPTYTCLGACASPNPEMDLPENDTSLSPIPSTPETDNPVDTSQPVSANQPANQPVSTTQPVKTQQPTTTETNLLLLFIQLVLKIILLILKLLLG